MRPEVLYAADAGSQAAVSWAGGDLWAAVITATAVDSMADTARASILVWDGLIITLTLTDIPATRAAITTHTGVGCRPVRGSTMLLRILSFEDNRLGPRRIVGVMKLFAFLLPLLPLLASASQSIRAKRRRKIHVNQAGAD